MSPIATSAKLSPHVGPFTSVTAVGTIPALNSDPDATAQLYLDFDGAPSTSWAGKTTGVTPAYDTDGDASTFTAGELANIQEIWARVAEIYSPFNINVTTVDPGNLTDLVTTDVIVGGTGSWYGSAGGVAFVGGFSNGASNIAWVFPKMLANGNTKYTAEAISHEAGHTFGLQHQSTYSGTTKTNEYNPGSAVKAPIMGNSYSATRALWWNGQSSISSTTIQNDVSVISGSSNAFGYRTDDHGGTTGTATPLDVDSGDVSGSGIIEQLTDKDYFSFTTLAGDITLTVSPAQYAGMLDATLTLLDSGGNVVVAADTSSLGETISTSVSSGTYYLAVGSKGNAGDLGQYTISGTIITSPDYVARPANLTATVSTSAVDLDWTDKSSNETGFVIERSSNGGSTWGQIGTAAANTTTYSDGTITVGQAYKYRVKATGSVQDSGYTSTVSANVIPDAPSDFAATSISATEIDLDWTDIQGETGYRIDRSLNGTTWTQLATPTAGSGSYDDTGLSATTKYYYRIVSLSGVGNSNPSTTANATTTPITPTTLTGSVATNSITLSWTNVGGETGYRIERSPDNSSWSQLATTAVNVATYANTGLSPNATYYYRVKAIGAGGDSPATSSISKTTLLASPSNVFAYKPSETTIKVSWADESGETGYRLEKLSGSVWSQVGSDLATNVTSAAVSGLTAGTSYSFRVSALNAGGASAASSVATGSTLPPAPGSLTATAQSSSQIKLTWANVAGETGFRIERSLDGSTSWKWIGTTPADVPSFTDSSLAAGTQYFYRIRALAAAGNGAYSATANATSLLSAPKAVTAAAMTLSKAVKITWSNVTGETGFKILRSSNGSSWTTLAVVGADVLSYLDATAQAGTYFYRVVAFRSDSISKVSPIASIKI